MILEIPFNLFLFLLYLGSEKFAINNSPVIKDDSTDYPEEPRDMPDYVETDYPVENKDDTDSDDYINELLKEIRNQPELEPYPKGTGSPHWGIQNQPVVYEEEPSEEIAPKVNPEWQGMQYKFNSFLSLYYFFKCNYIF